MSKIDINKLLLEIINNKHDELQLGAAYNGIFSKIKDFEANAIGQIGEEFARLLCKQVVDIEQEAEETIHNEYDIKTVDGIMIEVKTARKGRKVDTFQFNGIEPRRNYNYLLCIGLCYDKVVYRIFEHTDIEYRHKGKNADSNYGYFLTGENFDKKLVPMNPGSLVSYKLTVNIRDMYAIDGLFGQLQTLLKPV